MYSKELIDNLEKKAQILRRDVIISVGIGVEHGRRTKV